MSSADNTVTFLLSVYHGTHVSDLRQCCESISAQTRPADDVLFIADGPLTADVTALLDEFCATHNARTVALPENRGIGIALQKGVELISTTWIARLDTDDIAHPERLEKQLAYVEEHPDVRVLGTAVEEFHSTPGDVGTVRQLPSTHEQISRYIKINNPINHPSCMMHTATVIEAGGYRDVHFMEDYDLFARILSRGGKFHNLTQPLTYFRVSDEQFDRRTGKDMLSPEITLQKNLVRYGLITKPRAVANLVIRTAYRLLPRTALKKVYSKLFHRAQKG